jgi:hypothetical protein
MAKQFRSDVSHTEIVSHFMLSQWNADCMSPGVVCGLTGEAAAAMPM